MHKRVLPLLGITTQPTQRYQQRTIYLTYTTWRRNNVFDITKWHKDRKMYTFHQKLILGRKNIRHILWHFPSLSYRYNRNLHSGKQKICNLVSKYGTNPTKWKLFIEIFKRRGKKDILLQQLWGRLTRR